MAGQLDWTEERIQALAREDNRIERKSSRLANNEDKLRKELARQISAFANTGGGTIILGVADDGTIDGGLPVIWKGNQSTKGWLENIIPTLTEIPVIGWRVIDIRGIPGNSSIEIDKAVFVIEVPDSVQAPHQSAVDFHYYVRIGSSSQPAPHRLLEDIRNRARHPEVKIVEIEIPVANHRFLSRGQAMLEVTCRLKLGNFGRIRAQNICMLMSSNADVSVRSNDGAVESRNSGTTGRPYWEFRNPIYPGMDVSTDIILWIKGEVREKPTEGPPKFLLGGWPYNDVQLFTRIYADDAPFLDQNFRLRELDVSLQLQHTIQRAREEM